VWFPVVEAFPPLLDTKVNRRAEAGRMQKITYPEDKFRKQFYESFQTNQPLYLWGGHPSYCDRFVDACKQFVEEGMNDEEAVENAVNTFEFSKEQSAVSELEEQDDWDERDILDDKNIHEDYKSDDKDNLPPDDYPPDLFK